MGGGVPKSFPALWVSLWYKDKEAPPSPGSTTDTDSALLGVGTRGGGEPGRIGTGDKKAGSESSKGMGSGRNKGKTHNNT